MPHSANQNRAPVLREDRDTSVKPRVRDPASAEMVRMLAALNGDDPALVAVNKSCLCCQRFDETHEICRLYQARPHARVIAYGCIDFLDELEQPLGKE